MSTNLFTTDAVPPTPSTAPGKPPRPTKGLVNPAIVRVIGFIIITLSLAACTVLVLLAIWDVAQQDVIWRAIATFVVVATATGLFTFVNEKLG